MDQPDREAELKFFSQPVRQITMMIIVLGLVSFGFYIALPRVGPVFLANPYLNGFIAVVFIIGILACFLQVVQLVASVNWIERFTGQRPNVPGKAAPRLLAPLAALLRDRNARTQISSSSARSILDSVATRIDEARDITRYIANLLIFLGLLGTFYGLATTVPALVETIRSLSPSEGEGASDVLGQLMSGLENQLGGMGTAFASSLLGLAGSLVVGMLELFASHGQNRFFRELEEWLSTITRLGVAGDGDGDDLSGTVAVLDHMGRQMDELQGLFARSEAGRMETGARLERLASSIDTMVTRADRENNTVQVLTRVAEGQERLLAALQARDPAESDALDAESRMRLRSIDVQLLRILEELSAGRQESLAELRAEIAGLTRTLRDLGAQDQQGD
ncbi:biopolymer transporter ExbB [Celeribacter halophilus]|uniref:biopolymer transporter ExbB n=1 Tax=Celeribacter halophilus TaxID=576117 RepID=UPI002FD11218